jgi:hypothetical protein
MNINDIIKDNDHRMTGRRLEITALCDTHAFAKRIDYTGRGRGREFRIRLDRIHTDGKPRRSRFSLENVEAWQPATGSAPPLQVEACSYPPAYPRGA